MMRGWGMGMFPGHVIGMLIGFLVFLLVLAGLVALIVWLVRRLSRPAVGGHVGAIAPAGSSAKDILQQRYARGEIDREQYQAILADLDK